MRKRSTSIDYRGVLDNHVLPEFGNIPISDINRLMVKEFLMKKFKPVIGKNGLKYSTINRFKVVMGGVFNMAVDDEVIPSNPAHNLGKIFVKTKSESSKTINPLTRDELSLLLKTFKEHFPEHYPLALTLARTGMRSGEAYALQWGDIDFNGRFITIQRNLSRGYFETPKNGKQRRIDISMQLTETLWKLKRKREREFEAVNLSELVFIDKVGKPICERYWREWVFHKALNKAELRRIRVHDLRHTCASLLLQAGESMMYVKDLLGHHSIKITVDIYGHLVPGGNKAAVDRLDDVEESAPKRTLSAPKEYLKVATS